MLEMSWRLRWLAQWTRESIFRSIIVVGLSSADGERSSIFLPIDSSILRSKSENSLSSYLLSGQGEECVKMTAESPSQRLRFRTFGWRPLTLTTLSFWLHKGLVATGIYSVGHIGMVLDLHIIMKEHM